MFLLNVVNCLFGFYRQIFARVLPVVPAVLVVACDSTRNVVWYFWGVDAKGEKPWLARFFILIFFLLLSTRPSYAISYYSYGCEFTPEELETPDEAIINILEGVKFCPGIEAADGLEPFDRKDHPPRAMRRVYEAKSSIGWSYEALYAKFDIKKKEKAPDVEGMEHYVYRVEFLYVLIDGVEHDVKGATRDGYLPICERDVVIVHLIHTPWGWYPYIPTNYGDSIHGAIRRVQKHPPSIAQHAIKRYREISAPCVSLQQ